VVVFIAEEVIRVETSDQRTRDRAVRYRVFTRSSKRPALARVFWIHLLEVCWTLAGSCKHPINESEDTDPRDIAVHVDLDALHAAAAWIESWSRRSRKLQLFCDRQLL